MRFSKSLFALTLGLVFLGAGCFGGASRQGAVLDGGVYKSGNGGELWTHMTTLPTPGGLASIAATDVVFMEMDPQDAKTMYVSTREDGLLFTQDAAQSWQQPRDPALRTGRVNALAINPKDVCTLYLAKGGQLYKTIDCLRTLDKNVYAETRAEVVITHIEVDWYNPNTVWLGLSNGDILKSTDAGRTWQTAVVTGQPITGLLIHQKDSRKVLVGTQRVGLIATADAGKTWKQILKPLNAYEGGKRVESLTQDKNSRRVFMVSRYGILSSPDFGETWNKVNMLTSPGQVQISTLATDPSNPNVIYYSAANTFYTSYDHGNTWTTNKLPSTRVPTALLVDPANGSVIYMGVQQPVKK